MKLKIKLLNKIALWSSIIGIVVFLLELGFPISYSDQKIMDIIYFLIVIIGLLSTFGRYMNNPAFLKRKVMVFDTLSVIYTLYITYLYIFDDRHIVENSLWLISAIVLSFIREFSEIKINLNRNHLNPFQLFILSFIVIIFIGAFLLMLPRATYGGISFINALFTSTSAVCVTGLIVVDTGTYFTTFGQIIILFLIQIGGLGILTFVSYFSYFFNGNSTYENQLVLREITYSQTIGDVFQTLKNIILITVTVELISALLIFASIDETSSLAYSKKILFSIFHSVSAFCNAGFSTLSDNIYSPITRYNYPLQLVLISTFILGGLGFPIVSNILKYIKHKFFNLFKSKRKDHRPWVLNINSRITLTTSLYLIVVPFFILFFIEYDNALSEHSLIGKSVNALFCTTMPRTSGFNAVDMSLLSLPSIIIIIFLMWIGASPASTGGGIKTSTFALAVLNILSLAKGKNGIEVYRREISDTSVRRAFATIGLSILTIGLGIILISIFDPEKGLLNITFECVSAYSTVGLSLGITGDLSLQSKIVLIIIMFVGRVSMLSIITAIFKKIKYKNYRYPSEEITIN